MNSNLLNRMKTGYVQLIRSWFEQQSVNVCQFFAVTMPNNTVSISGDLVYEDSAANL